MQHLGGTALLGAKLFKSLSESRYIVDDLDIEQKKKNASQLFPLNILEV